MDLYCVCTVAGGALFPLVGAKDARALRAACKAARASVAAYPWGKPTYYLESAQASLWHACFPHAVGVAVADYVSNYKHIVDFAACAPQLRQLTLCVWWGTHEPFSLADLFRCLPQLREVCIKTRCDVTGLTEALAAVPQLQLFELDTRTDALAIALAAGLAYLPHLRTLSCWPCEARGLAAVQSLACAITQLVELRALDVAAALAETLVASVFRLPALRVLCLRSCMMDVPVVHSLAANLVRMPHLTNLVVQNAQVSADGMGVLAVSLQHVPCLADLDVRGNPFGDAGACALAAALAHTPQLRHLYIGGCDIEDAGIAAVAAALKHVPQLECFGANDNKFEEVGLAVLAAALANAVCLVRINLSECAIMDEGAWVLAAALVRLPRLKYLDLCCSGISCDGDGALAQHLPHVKCFTYS